MIQRIQSIFLLLAAGCFGAEFATSFASSSQSTAGIFADQLFNLSDHFILQILAGLGTVISLIAIFLYNNRKLQLNLSKVLTTLAILLPLAAVLVFNNNKAGLENVEVADQAGLYLPIGMLVFSLLAARFISKDEKLVSSMDRLR